MKSTSYDLLVCPCCRAALSLDGSAAHGIIERGSLSCSTCEKVYPIREGIPRFIKVDELGGNNQKFSHLYDWFSLIYPEFSRVGFRLLGTTDAYARQELIARLAPSGRVLEVSIGPGVNLPFLLGTPDVTEVFGLDISPGQLNRCRRLIRRNGWAVDLFLGNGEELPFKDDTFDSVFHVGGINFFDNKRKAIEEMIRVAKPGTKIIICDENESGARWYEKYLPGFKSAFHGERQLVTAPIDLVPSSMIELKLEDIWNSFMYCLEFRKPYRLQKESIG